MLLYPFLQIILGQKCGIVGIPCTLLLEDFEAIRRGIKAEGNDLEFLEQWYHKESNSVPATYVLQKPESVLGKNLLLLLHILNILHLRPS